MPTQLAQLMQARPEAHIAAAYPLLVLAECISRAPDPGTCWHMPADTAQPVSCPCWRRLLLAQLMQTRWSPGAGLHLQGSYKCPGAQPEYLQINCIDL
eukprot:1159704-Pelagomonas_calceolata.AAC.5